MTSIRTLIRKVPGAVFIYRKIIALSYKLSSTEKVFTSIYEGNRWGGNSSLSGRGSDPDQTKELVEKLPAMLKAFQISSILDIPCGDFAWMKNVDLTGIDYHGADIVEKIVEENKEKYSNATRKFTKTNLLTDELPDVDLIFCRDCLVHLSYKDNISALHNISNSSAIYLAATTFSGRDLNSDILTGHWRPLNLQKPPFNFPEPLYLLDEKCTESNGNYRDKMMGVWKIADLKSMIQQLAV